MEGIWTGNGSEFTLEFNKFWDEDYHDLIYDGDITTLFPNTEYLTADMQAAIKDHFWYRQIGEETPQKFLRHFQRIILERAYNWGKLIQSMSALRDEDMIYNYDLHENSTGERTDQSAAVSTGANTGHNFVSDTPDNYVNDIENYMSEASKNTADSSGSSSTTGHSESEGTLRRYGNIGVMTAEQIIRGYRDATAWNAYDVMYADLEKCFLGVF